MEIKQMKDKATMVELTKIGNVYCIRSCVYANILVDGTPYSFLPSLVEKVLDWTDYNLIVETSAHFAIDLKKEDVHFTKDGEKIIYDKFTCENIVKRAREIKEYIIEQKYKELKGNILNEKMWDDIEELGNLNINNYKTIPYSFNVVVDDKLYSSSTVLEILREWEEMVLEHVDIFNVEKGRKNHSIRMMEIRCAVKRGKVFKRTGDVSVETAKEISLYIKDVDELRQSLLTLVGDCPVKRLLVNGMCNSIKLK